MNTFLKEVFGRKRKEATGSRRKLYLADIRDFLPLKMRLGSYKQRRYGRTRMLHVLSKIACTFRWWKLKERENLEEKA